MPQAGFTGSEAAEAINSFGALAPSLVPQSWSWEPEERRGTGVVLNSRDHPSFGMGCFLQLPPRPSQLGVDFSPEASEGTPGEGEDFGQARGAERVLVLASLSQAA